MFDVNVTKMRVAPHDGVAVYFTIELGERTEETFIPIFTISECALVPKRAGGYFWRGPGRKMMQGQEPMLDAKGYQKYFRFFQSYACEDESGKFGRTKAAFKFEDRVTELAVAKLAEMPEAPAPVQRERATQSAGSTKVTEGADQFDAAFGGELTDDDLPF